MSDWDRFVFSFFNADVIEQYLPLIVDGFFLTCLLAEAAENGDPKAAPLAGRTKP